MSFEIPKKGRVTQVNDGDVSSMLHMSQGIDLITNRGTIRNSPALLNILDQGDETTYSDPMYAISYFSNGGDADAAWFGVAGDRVYQSSGADPLTGWDADAHTSTPTTVAGNRADIIEFDSLLLVSAAGASADDIYALPDPSAGQSWTSWWQTQRSQSALSTVGHRAMRVNYLGALYFFGSSQKIFKVLPNGGGSGTITTSGNGVLDFTGTSYRFTCMEMTSSRCWIGTYNESGREAVILEWDMNATSTTPNRTHRIPAVGVVGIAIWNDVPYAMLSNGKLYVFNGTQFVSTGAQLPRPPQGLRYRGDIQSAWSNATNAYLMHPNGWSVLDGYPHFLINTKLYNATELTGAKATDWKAPSGIWCYDPEVGLYCRYAIDLDVGAGNSVGYSAVNAVGALALARSSTGGTSLLAGVDFYTDTAGTTKAALLADDVTRSVATRARFATTPLRTLAPVVWQKIETLARKLGASDSILIKYRLHPSSSLPGYADVTWASTTQFTSTSSTFASASDGDEVYVILGDGSGCSAHISSSSYSNPTYTVNLDATILGVAASDTSTVRVDTWRKLATITNTQVDYHSYDIPSTVASHKIEFLIELRAGAGSTVEIDQIIIN